MGVSAVRAKLLTAASLPQDPTRLSHHRMMLSDGETGSKLLTCVSLCSLQSPMRASPTSSREPINNTIVAQLDYHVARLVVGGTWRDLVGSVRAFPTMS
jgi:hypothetical protein